MYRTRYRIGQEVIETALDSELILLHASTQEMFSLNDTARVIWGALRRGGESAAVSEVLARYDLPRERAENDVAALAAEFVDLGLLEAEGDGTHHDG